MIELDEIDRKLIDALTLDARASVTTLAGQLKLARGTVQTRLARLIESRAVKRFTVELGEIEARERVNAIMMIEVRGNAAASIEKALKRLPEVVRLHRTCGVWDMVIQLETATLSDFDSVLNRIREIPGVANSATCPLLREVV